MHVLNVPIFVEKYEVICCFTSIHEECLQHHGHKGDPIVTFGTYSTEGEKTQVILIRVKAPSIEIASYPRSWGQVDIFPWPLEVQSPNSFQPL